MYNFNVSDIDIVTTIPTGTLVEVRLSIKCVKESQRYNGNMNEINQQDFHLLTVSKKGNSLYLNVELEVCKGIYSGKKIYERLAIIGVDVDKWIQLSKVRIKKIIEYYRKIDAKDVSLEAQEKRKINRLSELNGVVFAIIVTEKTDDKGRKFNQIDDILHYSVKDGIENISKNAVNSALEIANYTPPF